MGNRILLIGKESAETQTLARALRNAGFEVETAEGPENVFQTIHRRTGPARPDLLLVDLSLSSPSVFRLAHQLTNSDLNVPVLLIASPVQAPLALKCCSRGADDFILTPLQTEVVQFRIHQVLEQRRLAREMADLKTLLTERTDELQELIDSLQQMHHCSLDMLLRALDWRERETRHHSCRVALAAVTIARHLGMSTDFMRRILIGGLLHDIGKIGVPDSVLMKEGALTEPEWETMRLHPEMGCDIVTKTESLVQARDVVLSHHERFDGSGYPHGLKGEDIPLQARIFSVADTLDAMTSDRPYRPAQLFQTAAEEIRRCSGAQFDPDVVSGFLQIKEVEWQRIRRQAEIDGWNHFQAGWSLEAANEFLAGASRI